MRGPQGARQNNLKNISLRLPHNKVIAVTGLSGSGKSSLAFDTIFAEGQWRYVESLSTYARMFLEKVARPDVDRVLNGGGYNASASDISPTGRFHASEEAASPLYGFRCAYDAP